VLQYQIGSSAYVTITNLNYASVANGASIGAIDLSGFTALQNVGANTNITFRIVNYGATSSGGTWYIYNNAGTTALDLALQGTVTPVSAGSSPTLSVRQTNATVVLSWPLTFDGFVLQQNTNLLTTNWTVYVGGLVTNGSSLNVVVTNAVGNCFFRLMHP
jgi:hypothetical protein